MKRKTLETYEAANGQHGWRVRGTNGRIVASGGETFKRSHKGALRAAVGALDLRAIDATPHPTKPHHHVIDRVVDDRLMKMIRDIAPTPGATQATDARFAVGMPT